MKKFLFLFVGLCIAGFTCFALSFWVFKKNFNQALQLSVVLAVAWVVIQLIREYGEIRKKRSNSLKK